MKIITLPLSYLKISSQNSLISVRFSSDVSFSIFIPMILNIGSVIKVVPLFFFKVLRTFHAVLWEVTGKVAPMAFPVVTILGLVSKLSAMVTLAVEGVGVFSDHILTLVGGPVCL